MYLSAQDLAVNIIDIYQRFIKILLPSACRFWPSCSEYTKQAIIKYGLFKGGLIGQKRLLKCHPFCQKSGYDPLL